MAPYAGFSGFSGFQPGAMADLAGQGGRPPSIPNISPEDEQTLLGRLGSTALGGLGWLGSTLDKFTGGRAIRGLLAGKPHELLSLLPGSDVLGITDSGQTTNGRQLLDQWGVTDPNQDESFFSPGNLAGMATDIALSPATYLSLGGGAVAKGLGETAKRAGLGLTRAEKLGGLTMGSPKLESLARAATGTEGLMGPLPRSALEPFANVRLGGDIGVGLPFKGNNLGTYDLSGVGNLLAKVPGASQVGQVLGATGSFLDRNLGALFKGSRMGRTEADVIPLAEQISQGLPGARYGASRDLGHLLEQAANKGILNDPQAMQDFFRNAEGFGTGPHPASMQDLLSQYAGTKLAAEWPGKQLGLTNGAEELVPRVKTAFPGKETPYAKGLVPREQVGEEFLKGLPTVGPNSVNELAANGELRL